MNALVSSYKCSSLLSHGRKNSWIRLQLVYHYHANTPPDRRPSCIFINVQPCGFYKQKRTLVPLALCLTEKPVYIHVKQLFQKIRNSFDI